MKRILLDHGQILHWMGAHHMFPVKGAGAGDVSFGSHGALDGKTPIGWNEFFPALAKAKKVVLVDDEAGTAAVVAAQEAEAQAPSKA
jgi:hypothetical protein